MLAVTFGTNSPTGHGQRRVFCRLGRDPITNTQRNAILLLRLPGSLLLRFDENRLRLASPSLLSPARQVGNLRHGRQGGRQGGLRYDRKNRTPVEIQNLLKKRIKKHYEHSTK